MTPLYVSIAASVASILLILVVLRADPEPTSAGAYALLWLPTGVVLLVLSTGAPG